jgi:tripartite-type tricarboxylate transporter receptor subunit TctC
MARLIASVVALICAIAAAQAQPYPSRPIRLIVTAAAGGSADTIARTISGQAQNDHGWTFVVDNRPGAAGIIAYSIVAKAPSDGYTVLHATANLIINPSIYRKLPYDLERDFTPVTTIGLAYGYLIIVNPSVPARSLKELIALARNKDKPLLYGSSGIGNTLHLVGATFNEAAGTHLMHVAYKGGPPVMNALMSGEIQVIFAPPTAVLQYVRAGKMRAVGFTGRSRWELLPDVPTVAEAAIPGFDVSGSWHAWFVPGKTPAATVSKIYQAVHQAIQAPKVREFLKTSGYEPHAKPPDEFARFVVAETRRYAEEVRKAGVEPQ